MKRFYTEVVTADGAVLLDGRPVRTPSRAPLLLPTRALENAVADEWRAQGETIDPRTMPLTGLANAAIDRVAPDPVTFAEPLGLYARSDLLCYRAEGPQSLVEAQARAWDPLLEWAQSRYEVRLVVAAGIVHVTQPEMSVTRLGEALLARDAFALAAMQPLVTIGGSLIVALAVAERRLGVDEAFAATHLDELWQAERWGEDAWAVQTRAARLVDFHAAAHFLALLA